MVHNDAHLIFNLYGMPSRKLSIPNDNFDGFIGGLAEFDQGTGFEFAYVANGKPDAANLSADGNWNLSDSIQARSLFSDSIVVVHIP